MMGHDMLTHTHFARLVADPELMLSKRVISLASPANCSCRFVASKTTVLKPVVRILCFESLGWGDTSQLHVRGDYTTDILLFL